MILSLAAVSTPSALAEEWNLISGEGEAIGFQELESGDCSLYLPQLKPGFYIESKDGLTDYGTSEIVKVDETYTLTLHGNNVMFEAGVKYISDAVITFNPTNATILIQGTPVGDDAVVTQLHVAGSFNEWSLTDPEAVLELEPGTQIFVGSVELDDETNPEFVTWRLYSSTESLTEGSWGLELESHDNNQLNGILEKGSLNAVSTKAGEYNFWFNSATGEFRLTPVENTNEKKLIVEPDPEVVYNMFNEFKLTFQGYNTAVADPSMYDVMNAPGTVTQMSTGDIVSKVGIQPLPIINNVVMLQFSQTIYNKELLDQKQVEPGDLDKYVPYENGKYLINIPRGMITLNDGLMVTPNEEIEILLTLGNTEGSTGVAAIAPEFEGMDVYTLDGVLKVRNASAEDINALPRGLYIVKGHKFFKK